MTEAFVRGAENLGIPRNPDYNGASQTGVGYMQRVIEHGRRVSAARAYLPRGPRRNNLDIILNALTERIVLEGKTAVGVAFTTSPGARQRVVKARREVIVSAGSLNTPKLLQLSGIGPAAVLQRLGVEPKHHLPASAANLCDHYGDADGRGDQERRNRE